MSPFSLAIAALLILGVIYTFSRKPPHSTDPEVIKKELECVYELIKPNELESIKIHPKKELPVKPWNSRFGGIPYWLRGNDYPVDHKGKPFILLAQINLEELPSLSELPSQGILQFFIAQNGSWGLEYENKKRSFLDIIDTPTGYKIIFHEDVVKNENELINELPFKLRDNSLPFNGVYSLVFERIVDRLAPSDYRFDRVVGDISNLDDATIDVLFDELDSSDCKIGGYANFTQDDPRGYADIGEWVLLFQMDSVTDDGVDIMWGDVGVANFFIQPDALNRKDFSRILYNWDCC